MAGAQGRIAWSVGIISSLLLPLSAIGAVFTIAPLPGQVQGEEGTPPIQSFVYGWRLTWPAAEGESPEYQVLYSATAPLDTVEGAQKSGTVLMDWGPALTYDVTTLPPLAGAYTFVVLSRPAGGGPVTAYEAQAAFLNKYVYFVTVPNGNLGGIAGADTLCQQNMDPVIKTQMTGFTPKAMLVDGSVRVAPAGTQKGTSWVLTPNTHYFYPNGLEMGETDENGKLTKIVNGSSTVWWTAIYTGLTPEWGTAPDICGAWIQDTSTSLGMLGLPVSTDGTFWSKQTDACATAASLLCVQP
jgi:hypothetical protein